jgi:hypothetical protein
MAKILFPSARKKAHGKQKKNFFCCELLSTNSIFAASRSICRGSSCWLSGEKVFCCEPAFWLTATLPFLVALHTLGAGG